VFVGGEQGVGPPAVGGLEFDRVTAKDDVRGRRSGAFQPDAGPRARELEHLRVVALGQSLQRGWEPCLSHRWPDIVDTEGAVHPG
jgi:hypothetical protein